MSEPHESREASVCMARSLEQRLDVLHRLRAARTLILADAEAFVEAAAVLEYVGQIGGKNTAPGLGHYRDEIISLAKETGRFDKAKDERDLKCLFDTVLAARNSAAHTGSYARHLSSRLVELILILEEAITHGEPRMSQKSTKTDDTAFKLTKVKHLMVGGLITAFDWNTLGQIRTLMLEHSFTYIPVKRAEGLEPRWVMISDAWLMATLRKAGSRTAWNKALGKTIETALTELGDQQKLHAMAAHFCDDSDTVDSVVERLRDRPLLVRPSNRPEEIVGIIAAYDLL